MKLLSYLAFLTCLASLSVALLSLWLDRRAWQNRVVGAAGLLYAWWALCMTFVFGSGDQQIVLTAYHLMFFGSVLMAPVLTTGYLAFAGVRRSLLTAFAVVFGGLSVWSLVVFWTGGFFYTRFEDGPWGNHGIPADGDQFWALATPYIGLAQVVIALAALIRTRITTASGRTKRQLNVLIPGLVASLVLYFLAWLLEIVAGWPNAMVLCGLPLITTMFWIIFRYRYLRPDTRLLERAVGEASDANVLLDAGGIVVAAHPSALGFLGPEAVGRPFAGLLEGGTFTDEWERARSRSVLHRRLPGRIAGQTLLLTLSPRFVRAGAFDGAVVFLSRLELWDRQIASLNMTAREKDILFLLLEGRTNAEMADRLGLSPSTVKRHCHNIFDKAEVSSRAELLGMLLGTA
jgi:DNA-binding CsgD family transcriptional regulator